MFLGHFAVAFAAKRAAPAVSLGLLFVAAQLADLLWPLLVLAGVERVAISPGITAITPLDFQHYPYSHSLAALGVWALAFGFIYRIARGSGGRAFLVIAGLVLSHWFLDVLSHRPDMPIGLGESPKMGLGLWNSVPATLAAELALFAAGIAVYARTTRAVDRIGSWAFGGLIVFLLVMYAGAVFGPPPPSVDAVAWSGIAMWLIMGWAFWIDRHRAAS